MYALQVTTLYGVIVVAKGLTLWLGLGWFDLRVGTTYSTSTYPNVACCFYWQTVTMGNCVPDSSTLE